MIVAIISFLCMISLVSLVECFFVCGGIGVWCASLVFFCFGGCYG